MNNKKLNKNKIRLEVNQLKILYTNADSLNNKKDELETIISQQDIDIALICESLPKNLNSSLQHVPLNLIIEGYDSLEDNTGRGVIMIYKDHLELQTLTEVNNLYSPAIYAKIANSQNQIHLAVVYRSPNVVKEDDEKLNNQIKKHI